MIDIEVNIDSILIDNYFLNEVVYYFLLFFQRLMNRIFTELQILLNFFLAAKSRT